MISKKEKVSTIIHGSATASAAAAAGLAQIPTSDNAVIAPIQLAMIIAIGGVYGKNLSQTAAVSMLASVSAGVTGRAISQILFGWIPGWGNATNATTAFAITETVGWAADKILSKG